MGDTIMGSTEDAKQTGRARTLTSEQQALLKQLNQLMSSQLGKGVDPYEGSMVGGPTDIQKNIFSMVGEMTKGGMPEANQTAMDAINKILNGSADPQKANVEGYDVGEFDPSAVQDWYKNALVNPAMKTWESEIAPKVQEKFIAQNAGSSGAANRAISKSAGDMMGGLNAQLANALMGEKGAHDTRKFTAGMDETNKGYQAEMDYLNKLFSGGQSDLDRAATVPGSAIAASNQPMEQLMKLLQVGGQEFDINNMMSAGEYQKWAASQDYNNPWLKLIAPALGTKAFEPIVQGPTQTEGLMSSVIGPMMGGWAKSGFKTGG